MGDIDLSFEVTGADTLIKDLESELDDMVAKFAAVGETASSVAESTLENHIQKDVYDKWSPKIYERTGGITLERGVTTVPFLPARQGMKIGVGFRLRYRPDGTSEQWENPAHSDDLIRRIESGRGYEWKKHPGPRPYWTNYTEELLRGDTLAQAVLFALMGQGLAVDGSIEIENTDGDGYEY